MWRCASSALRAAVKVWRFMPSTVAIALAITKCWCSPGCSTRSTCNSAPALRWNQQKIAHVLSPMPMPWTAEKAHLLVPPEPSSKFGDFGCFEWWRAVHRAYGDGAV